MEGGEKWGSLHGGRGGGSGGPGGDLGSPLWGSRGVFGVTLRLGVTFYRGGLGVPGGVWGHDEIWGQISGGALGVPWGGGGGGWGQILGEEGLGVPGGFLGSH